MRGNYTGALAAVPHGKEEVGLSWEGWKPHVNNKWIFA